MNAKDAMDCMVKMANTKFGLKTSISPMAFLHKGNAVIALPLSEILEMDNGREVARDIIKQTVRLVKPEVYAFIAEAWMTTPDKGEPFVRPRDSDKRQEIVTMIAEDATGKKMTAIYLIDRDPDGSAKLGKAVSTENCEYVFSYWHNMFAEAEALAH